ncbi:hypothetical protein ERIC1_1c01320 [Paenibacillus larvae subsp. larvae DSM 25719]|uniref:DUF4064 domain-containing protein n=1 Tax=Paenibacillus larvae TaxID=1464 RepID=UPI0003DD2877|nr:DUF4064 domain-containing protein [Paenibacillus larvae]ETK26705.1 hypothetical protein ERIC1_1c01320 [Paenibacillus larvae subsp. larvae DSM 25719]
MFVMSLLGGIFGILSGVWTFYVGEVSYNVGLIDDSLTLMGMGAVLCGALGIAAAAVSKANPRVAGVMCAYAGIGGLFCTGMLFALPAALLIVTAFWGVCHKEKSLEGDVYEIRCT